MLKSLRFERLQAHHLPRILEIENAAHSAPWSEKSFQNEIDHKHGRFLVAFFSGKIVGYGAIWLVIDEAHVTTLAIDDEFRRKGIGRSLMVELLNLGKAEGMLCSTLEVRSSNEGAIKLYENLGYKITNRRKSYYPDNSEDAMVMWLYDLNTWTPPA